MKKKKRTFKWVFFVVLLLILLSAFDIYRQVFRPHQGAVEEAVVVIPSGTSIQKIAAILKDQDVISNSFYFRWYLRLFYPDHPPKAGEYLFKGPLTMRQVVFRLIKGEIAYTEAVIPEGLNIWETARLLEEKAYFPAGDFLDAAAAGIGLISEIDSEADSLEGYLFPDTYKLHKGVTAEEMVGIMVKNFLNHLDERMKRRAAEIGLTIRQSVTLASLIEKETASSQERALISSVFHNRLRMKMKLDCDPTVIYALVRDGRYRNKLGWDDLKYDSPYNTRIYGGLPPGPICNSGAAAIEAALYPAETKYIYFVAKNYREHHFSESLNEHNRAVHKYIIMGGRDSGGN